MRNSEIAVVCLFKHVKFQVCILLPVGKNKNSPRKAFDSSTLF